MAKVKTGNSACTPDCDCACCAASCPYCVLAVLIDQLVAKGVSADKAAETAAQFVSARCCEK